jgi:hypothetical protein
MSVFLLDRYCSQRRYELPLLSFSLNAVYCITTKVNCDTCMQSLAINIGDGTAMEEVTVQELTEVGPFGASAWMIGLDALTAVEQPLYYHSIQSLVQLLILLLQWPY